MTKHQGNALKPGIYKMPQGAVDAELARIHSATITAATRPYPT